VVGQWFADWTPDFSTELKVSSATTRAPRTVNGTRAAGHRACASRAPAAGAPVGVSTNNRFLNIGTERSRHFNVLATETLDLYAGATWNLGEHELKFGIDYADNEVFNAFVQTRQRQLHLRLRAAPTASARSPTARATHCPRRRRRRQRPSAAVVLENFQRGRPSAYALQAPRGPLHARRRRGHWSYRTRACSCRTPGASTALTLMPGCAWTSRGADTPLPMRRGAAAAVAGSVTDTTGHAPPAASGIDNTVTLDGNKLCPAARGLQLEAGHNERRMQLRGGVGLFQGAAANVWLSNPFSNTGNAW
jgi:hypothetical protein